MKDNKATKRCWRCKQQKPCDQFYRDAHRTDGLSSKCKACNAALNYAWRHANPERYARQQARWVRKNRDKKRHYVAKYRRSNPEKFRARSAIRRVVSNEKMERQPCEVCGYFPAEAHHDDYKRPLDVRWLCLTHHLEIDGKVKRLNTNHRRFTE